MSMELRDVPMELPPEDRVRWVYEQGRQQGKRDEASKRAARLPAPGDLWHGADNDDYIVQYLYEIARSLRVIARVTDIGDLFGEEAAQLTKRDEKASA